MKSVSISDLKVNMKAHFNEVADSQDILIVTRPKKEELVVITMSMFNALKEAAYLMSSQRNAREMRESTSALKGESEGWKETLHQYSTLENARRMSESLAGYQKQNFKKRMIETPDDES